MSSTKRNRGRPRGTGLDDSPTLKKMADLLVADPKLKPTRAIKRVLEQPSETSVRRLQGKWKDHGARYLADAHARRAAVPVPARRLSAAQSFRTAHEIAELHKHMQDALSPAMRAAQEMMNSPGMLAAQEAARSFQGSATMRAIVELQNSPTMRAMRDLQSSPTMQAMRDLQESSAIQGLREAQAQLRFLSGY